jgi:hypothetical protein
VQFAQQIGRIFSDKTIPSFNTLNLSKLLFCILLTPIFNETSRLDDVVGVREPDVLLMYVVVLATVSVT